MRTCFVSLAQLLGIGMLADFVPGLVHWLEDTGGSPAPPVIGPRLIRPNIVRHPSPRFFNRLTCWPSAWDIRLISALVPVDAAASRPASSPSSFFPPCIPPRPIV